MQLGRWGAVTALFETQPGQRQMNLTVRRDETTEAEIRTFRGKYALVGFVKVGSTLKH